MAATAPANLNAWLSSWNASVAARLAGPSCLSARRSSALQPGRALATRSSRSFFRRSGVSPQVGPGPGRQLVRTRWLAWHGAREPEAGWTPLPHTHRGDGSNAHAGFWVPAQGGEPGADPACLRSRPCKGLERPQLCNPEAGRTGVHEQGEALIHPTRVLRAAPLHAQITTRSVGACARALTPSASLLPLCWAAYLHKHGHPARAHTPLDRHWGSARAAAHPCRPHTNGRRAGMDVTGSQEQVRCAAASCAKPARGSRQSQARDQATTSAAKTNASPAPGGAARARGGCRRGARAPAARRRSAGCAAPPTRPRSAPPAPPAPPSRSTSRQPRPRPAPGGAPLIGSLERRRLRERRQLRLLAAQRGRRGLALRAQRAGCCWWCCDTPLAFMVWGSTGFACDTATRQFTQPFNPAEFAQFSLQLRALSSVRGSHARAVLHRAMADSAPMRLLRCWATYAAEHRPAAAAHRLARKQAQLGNRRAGRVDRQRGQARQRGHVRGGCSRRGRGRLLRRRRALRTPATPPQRPVRASLRRGHHDRVTRF